VVITLLLILSLQSSSNFGPYTSIGLFIAGLVCTSRLILNDHKPFDVYAGLLLGALAQLVAWVFV
jgi:membrane-associated phospholipid phosphatase